MDKRHFIKTLLAGTGLCLEHSAFGSLTKMISQVTNIYANNKWTKEAMFYSQTPRGVMCGICPNQCRLSEGDSGLCRSRVCKDNKLFTIAYGNPCAVHIDPIEKKPLNHFLPGSTAYSIATAGCNLACLNCQNWSISQKSPKETRNYDMMPDKVVENCLTQDCKSIAYTYSEPITFYEYTYDTSVLARQQGIKNVLVSAGYINREPLLKFCKVIDAANIDLKSFSDDIYMKLNAGQLQPILNTLLTMKDQGVWLVITNLVVPSWTDDMEMIKRCVAGLWTMDFLRYLCIFPVLCPYIN